MFVFVCSFHEGEEEGMAGPFEDNRINVLLGLIAQYTESKVSEPLITSLAQNKALQAFVNEAK